VEDNPYDRELTLRVLSNQGWANRVKLCADGEEALNFIFSPEAGRPKVIFLDLKLPKLNGLEVLRHLKSDELTKTIPVVVLTSSQEESDIHSSYALGVNSYMVKPVDFDQFSQAVEDLGRYWLVRNQAPR
jgi:two-component system response regulator